MKNANNINNKELVYRTLLESQKKMSALELTKIKGASKDRTYISRILAQLIKEGRVASEKDGRFVRYYVADYIIAIDENLDLRKTQEDFVWRAVRKNDDFFKNVSEQAKDILSFTFTEMLNNAIDHSKSSIGHVRIWQENELLKFSVRDFGIGIFKSIMAKKKYKTEIEAMQEVLKGKLTTAPSAHSGEGIFWTSKIADCIIFESSNLRLTIDNRISDYTIEELEEIKIGTEVYFEVAKDTEKSLSALFHQYSFDHDNLTLDTTMIPIKLYREGEAWVSRSQAKHVLNGLEKFKKIVFDFNGIDLIGQGFADEIFRVFNIEHPDIILEPINMSPTVELLVKRAQNDSTGRE
ncbi:DUF4325 domain-containing protein [Candidatus Saccharibacteria bacterium]|nr:DUF4325 domain-containing protein [Candidatus Saccharibacteria bacterium]